MAGNFWESSHYQQWLLDRQDIMRQRQHDLKNLTEEEYSKIMVFYANFLQALGEQLKVRQQVIATATVYFKRFYSRNSLKSIDPLLMCPTCVLLASKVEEFGVISNSRLISTCQTVVKKFTYVWPNQEFPYRIVNVLECEFFLLESMDCCLILYHPYRPLTQYAADINSEESLLQVSWRIVNDTLRTDIPLMFPPYMIALACLHMACVIQGKDVKQWFAELSVNMETILEITKQILALYEMWKTYDEKKEIAGLLAKMPKPKTSPSRPPSQGPTAEPANQNPAHQEPTNQLQAAHQAANQIVGVASQQQSVQSHAQPHRAEEPMSSRPNVSQHSVFNNEQSSAGQPAQQPRYSAASVQNGAMSNPGGQQQMRQQQARSGHQSQASGYSSGYAAAPPPYNQRH